MKQSTPDEVETSKSSDETMDLESKKDITNHSNEENKQETVKEEKEEDDDEEEAECPFCLFMKGGGCKENFIAWENCVEEGEKNNEDIVEKCFEVTTLLKKCMEANPEYYEPILKAEKAMEEEVSQTLEQESQSETTTTATTSTKSEDNDDMVQKTFTQDKQV
ncbi:hypothetical protein ZOSMA_375G00040 [Zostera marina]|uniref:GCK domain-containing protein n=1 Tax=Zostera marina TaxID=29655 RepID=A0A0K9P5L7_ZOSMR|nr:hypothetical protein ZOSMA_375G00040 [Zostera marina]